MAQDIEKLTIALEANIKQFEKSMDDARRKSESVLGDIERDVSRSVENVSSSFGKLGAVLAAGVSAAGLIEWARSTTKALSDIQKQAVLTATSVEQLASLQFLAASGGVDKDKALKEYGELAKKVYKEIKDEEGELTKLFKENGLSLTERNGNMRELKEIIADVAGLVANANNVFDAQEILKKAGLSEEFVGIFRRGKEAVSEMISEGERLNAGLGDAAAKAAEFQQRWDDAWARWANGSKSAILMAMELLEGAVGLAKRLVDSIPKGSNVAGSTIDGFMPPGYEPPNSNTPSARPASPFGRLANGVFGELDPGAAAAQAALDRRYGAPMPPTRPKGILTGKGGTKIPGEDSSGGGKSGSEETTAYDREIASIQRKTRALQAEASAVGLTVLEGARKEALTRLQLVADDAGIKLTDEQIKKNHELADAYAKTVEKLKTLELAQQQWVELQNFAGNSMISLFKGATSGADGLRDAVKRLADSLLDASLQAMILGKGPLAGLFGTGNASNGGVGGLIGTLFGAFGSSGSPLQLAGARAAGGPVSAGRPYLIGERGPEIMVPGHSGSVFPIAKGGASAGSNVVNITQAFQVSGAFTSDDAKAMAMQAATRAGAATRQSVLAELNSQRKRA